MKKSVIITIIVGIVCIGIGYLIATKMNNSSNSNEVEQGNKANNSTIDNTNTNTETNTKEEDDNKQTITFNKDEVKDELMAYFNYFGTCQFGLKLDSSKSKYYLKDLNSAVVYDILYNYLKKNDLLIKDEHENEFWMYDEEFNKSDLQKGLIRIFGKDAMSNFTLAKKFYMDFYEYTLNESTNRYRSNKDGGTGCEPGYGAYYLYDYKLSDDNKSFTLDFVYYYKDEAFDDEGNSVSAAWESEQDEGDYICKDSEVKNNIDKFDKYRYNFKLEEDHFVFNYIELVK